MRAVWLGFVGLGVVMLAWPALAQNQSSSFFTGVNPRHIQSTPIDTGKALRAAQASVPAAFKPRTSTFNLSRAFHSLSLTSFTRRSTPKMSILSPKSNPFQPNPPKGRNPFENAIAVEEFLKKNKK